MKITCISDLHGFLPTLPGGDLLIVAGDLTARDRIDQYLVFNEWLSRQEYERKIVIAGNHDGLCEQGVPLQEKGRILSIVPVLADKAVYLFDSAHEYNGLKIWGSPWTPTFFNWHFMKDRGKDIKEKWDLIPDDTEILVTHGPAYGIQDQVEYSHNAKKGNSAGCEELRVTLDRLRKLKLHVFGHVHEGYGMMKVNGVIHVNASIMDQDYRPVNKPITVEL